MQVCEQITSGWGLKKIPERIRGNTHWCSGQTIVSVTTRQSGKPHNSEALGTQGYL